MLIRDLLRLGSDSYPGRWLGYEDTRLEVLKNYVNRGYIIKSLVWDVVGIDVSYFQGEMNWSKAKPLINFAFIRARDGIYTGKTLPSRDEQFVENWAESKLFGIPRGAYMYFRPQQSPTWQADLFLEDLNGDFGELPPVLDVENTGGLGRVSLTNAIINFLNRFESQSGKKMTIYTSKSFWDYYVSSSTEIPHDRLCYTAHYNNYVTSPRVPLDWTSKGLNWTFWQYSSTGSGSYFGAQSRYIDLNRYNGSVGEFNQQFGLGDIPPVDPNAIVPIKIVQVTANALNMRTLPRVITNPDNDIGTVKYGDDLPITEIDGDWGKVEGWIHLGYTKDL